MKKILKGIFAGVLSISCMMLPVDVKNTTLGMSKVKAAEDDGYQVVDFDASDSMEGAAVTNNDMKLDVFTIWYQHLHFP